MASRTADPAFLNATSYETQIPSVYIEREPRRQGVDTIDVDNREAARLAAGRLISTGHTKIGIVTGLLHTLTGEQLYTEFEKTLRNSNLELSADHVYKGDFKMEVGEKIAKQILNTADAPTAIFFSSDLTAFSTMSELLKNGIRIPENIAVLGNADLPMSRIVSPKLTTIRYPIYEHGLEAAELLIQRLNNPERPAQKVKLKPKLIIRESA